SSGLMTQRNQVCTCPLDPDADVPGRPSRTSTRSSIAGKSPLHRITVSIHSSNEFLWNFFIHAHLPEQAVLHKGPPNALLPGGGRRAHRQAQLPRTAAEQLHGGLDRNRVRGYPEHVAAQGEEAAVPLLGFA